MMDKTNIALGTLSNAQNWVRLYYADSKLDRAFADLFGTQKYPTTLYLSANYTHIKYHKVEGDCSKDVFDAFFPLIVNTLLLTVTSAPFITL